MARAKKTSKATRRSKPARVAKTEEELSEVEIQPSESYPSQGEDTSSRPTLFSKRNIILFVLLVLVLLAWRFRGYFVVATVNGQPISRWELNDQMTRRFGAQTLDNIVNERLILGASRQKGIFVTDDEINKKMKEIETRLQGQASLQEAIAAQGMTEDMFRRQLEIQISIEKMFDKEASVSGKEIDDYIAANAEVYKEATDQAKLREDVKAILSQQKIGEQFDKWFADIKKNASINKYL